MYVNDEKNAANIPFENTGGWNKWSTTEKEVTLNAGSNKMRIAGIKAGPNIDKFELIGESQPSGTCIKVDEGGTATLSCPTGKVISAITFASYGTPAGSCSAELSAGQCHAQTSEEKVKQLCEGKQSCDVQATNRTFGDPCRGTRKALAVKYSCSAQVDPPPPPPPPSTEGLVSSTYNLPEDKPLACDWYWATHYMFAVGSQGLPRPKYYSKCENPDTNENEVYVSLTVGISKKEAPFGTSGMMVRSVLKDGKLEVREARHFPECLQMQGVASSSDCSRVAAICHMSTPAEITKTADADVTNDTLADGQITDLQQLWLYEWNDGKWKDTNPPSEPYRVIAHKRVAGTTRAQLRHGEDEDTYGISTRVKVGYWGKHTNHALFVFNVERNGDSKTFTRVNNRGWSDLCGGVHAGHLHRMAYSPDTQRYAAVCTSDHERASVNFRMGDTRLGVPTQDRIRKYSFHRHPAGGRNWFGGGGPIVPVPGGGFLASVVGARNGKSFAEDDLMEIGVARIAANGYPLDGKTGEPIPVNVGGNWTEADVVSGVVKWVADKPNTHLAYPQLAYLGQLTNGEHRFLLGYGEMRELGQAHGPGPDDDIRLAYAYYLMEVDALGNEIPNTREKIDVGWSDLDDMVFLGQGRVAWVRISDSKLVRGERMPPCNGITTDDGVSKLQLNVYTSKSFRASQ